MRIDGDSELTFHWCNEFQLKNVIGLHFTADSSKNNDRIQLKICAFGDTFPSSATCPLQTKEKKVVPAPFTFFLCVCRASNNGPDVHWPLLMTQNREILVAHEYPDSWTLEKIKKTANGCAIDPSIHRCLSARTSISYFFLVISKLFPVSFIHCDRLRTC